MEVRGLAQRRSPLIMHLGDAHLHAHHLAEALRVGRQGLTLTSERGHRAIQARGLRLLGEIVSRFEPVGTQQADECYGQALAMADELDMRPLVTHCHLGLGKLHPRMGRNQQAPEHLATATVMYREMRLGFWLEQAAAESRTPA